MLPRGSIFQYGFLGVGQFKKYLKKWSFWAKSGGLFKKNPKNWTFHITWGSRIMLLPRNSSSLMGASKMIYTKVHNSGLKHPKKCNICHLPTKFGSTVAWVYSCFYYVLHCVVQSGRIGCCWLLPAIHKL